MILILIADDHAIVRAGLKQFVADQADMSVAGEAATGAETVSLVRSEEGERRVLALLRALPPELQQSLEVGP